MKFPSLLPLILLSSLLLAGCESSRSHRPIPYSGLDLRSTERLQERRRSLQAIEASYQAQGGPPTKMTNRRELARLSDEMAIQAMAEKKAIEQELARRFAQGDPRAHFPGVESFLTQTPQPVISTP